MMNTIVTAMTSNADIRKMCIMGWLRHWQLEFSQ